MRRLGRSTSHSCLVRSNGLPLATRRCSLSTRHSSNRWASEERWLMRGKLQNTWCNMDFKLRFFSGSYLITSTRFQLPLTSLTTFEQGVSWMQLHQQRCPNISCVQISVWHSLTNPKLSVKRLHVFFIHWHRLCGFPTCSPIGASSASEPARVTRRPTLPDLPDPGNQADVSILRWHRSRLDQGTDALVTSSVLGS